MDGSGDFQNFICFRVNILNHPIETTIYSGQIIATPKGGFLEGKWDPLFQEHPGL